MATIFTRIAAGEIPSFKCAEDENFYAFLDINPLAPGHTLVIPKHIGLCELKKVPVTELLPIIAAGLEG